MKGIAYWIQKKKINICLLSNPLVLFNALPFTWWNGMVSPLAQNTEGLKQLHFPYVDTGWHSVPVSSLFWLSSQDAWWEFSMHRAKCMRCCAWFSFFPFAPVTGRSSRGRILVCVWLFLCHYMCWYLSAFEYKCPFTCLERFIAGSMQDLEASVDQVTKHE